MVPLHALLLRAGIDGDCQYPADLRSSQLHVSTSTKQIIRAREREQRPKDPIFETSQTYAHSIPTNYLYFLSLTLETFAATGYQASVARELI